MKKIFLIFLLFCSFTYSSNQSIIYVSKPANINQANYRNMISLPFGFSVDLQEYTYVIYLGKNLNAPNIILSDIKNNNLLSLEKYPFGNPSKIKIDFENEDKFLSEIKNKTSPLINNLYANSTTYIYELSNNYTAYCINSARFSDEWKVVIFKNSKYIITLNFAEETQNNIENILYSIRQNNEPFLEDDYIKKIKELYRNDSLQRALLHSSIYYLYDLYNKENLNLLNKIIDKIVLTMVLIKNDISE
ncbi:MAG: hypothetical protein LBG21_06700 [Campylobacteraceae bacterium]|jgi:hypothetical protein|nr:hypothetical protein [Campylobacteraceae bacterium]